MVVTSTMGQNFKTIYFADHPAKTNRRKKVTIAFGQRDDDTFERVSNMSSEDIRRLLRHNTFASLKSAAQNDNLALNTYCVRELKSNLDLAVRESGQLYLAGIGLPSRSFTFRTARDEPMHMWYPFLEGYAPEFVEEVISFFAPNAATVLDPFAGTGTTPVTCARAGRKCFYSEISPLLQTLVQAKCMALRLAPKDRARLAADLDHLSQDVAIHLRHCESDSMLKHTYESTFGKSVFFDQQPFDLVLRSRTLVDDLAYQDKSLALLTTIAVLRSLIPASRLIRAGDLRYKTEKEKKTKTKDLLEELSLSLRLISEDLLKVEPSCVRPIMVCEDARNLNLLRMQPVDVVVTSPPYLNGTNYFRNTKIELWFLRCLRDGEDLRQYRIKAVTAGINDVSREKGLNRTRASVDSITSQLEQAAYDQRIPRMVRSYFEDMEQVCTGLIRCVRRGGRIAIDIGDSIYAGVHVPTDRILVEIMEDLGCESVGEIVLRRRLSRSKAVLRQVLLLFERNGAKATYPRWKNEWRKGWYNFKCRLPHQATPYCKRNWGHPLHSLCSYQGKMKPSLAHHLVRSFVRPGSRMLDPFAGVGTIPFEAALLGIEAFGFEISPAAWAVAHAKTCRPSVEAVNGIIDELTAFLRGYKPSAQEVQAAHAVGFNGKISDYYHKKTLHEILAARRYFHENRPENSSVSLVLACLLHILHGNRPYALSRRSHSITPFAPTGEFEYRELIPRLKEKVSRSLQVGYPEEFVDGHIIFQDATSWWPQEITELDAIITSPPFFESTRFHLANWIRLWFCGWEAEDFKIKPLSFVDELQRHDFAVYEPFFRQARERLKVQGVLVMHLGKSVKCDMAAELERVAAPWFTVADTFSERVAHCESHGIRDKGTVTEHQYLVLQ